MKEYKAICPHCQEVFTHKYCLDCASLIYKHLMFNHVEIHQQIIKKVLESEGINLVKCTLKSNPIKERQ